MKAGCAEVRQAFGVYVVGAIDPAERALVDRHLAVCRDCRDELSALAGLPALLGRVSLQEVERAAGTGAVAAPPERLLNSLLDEMAGERRTKRRRSVLLAAAAAVLILAVAGTGAAAVHALVSRPAAAPAHVAAGPHWTKVSGRNAATNVSAVVRFVPRSWGTELTVVISGVPYGTRCELWVTDSAGARIPVGGWQYRDDEASYPGSTAVPAGSIRSFAVTAHGTTLVTVPTA